MFKEIGNRGKLLGIAFAAGLGCLTLGSGSALAANPHFVRADIGITGSGDIICSWKEAGLGTNQNIDYRCGAEVVGVLERCFTKSGNQPQADNKVSTARDVDVIDTFNSGKNGQVTASLTAEAPSGDRFCPSGQVQRVVAVRWCNASLEDLTNGLVGASATELHRELIPGAGVVPSCEELLATP